MSRLMISQKKIIALVVVGGLAAGLIFMLRFRVDGPVAHGRDGKLTPDSRVERSHADSSKKRENTTARARDKTSEGLDIGTARKLIDDFNSKNKDIGDRSIFVSDLIARLCKEGNSALAWELIESGSGTLRNAGLGSFFTNADLPREELIKRISDLPYKSDPSVAFAGFVERIGVNELEAFFATNQARSLLGDSSLVLNASGAVTVALDLAIMEGRKADDVIAIGLKLAQSGNLDNAAVIKLIRENSTKDVFEQWKLIEPLGTNSRYGQVAENSKKELVREMVAADAAQAMNILVNGEGRSDGDLKVAVQSWSQIDSVAAGSWYDTNKAKLTKNQRSSVASAISERALDHLEFDGARVWAAEISDEKARSQLLAKIDSKELERQKASQKKRN